MSKPLPTPDFTDITWRVRPHNKVEIVISQRHDIGHYYVSIREQPQNGGGEYEHRIGSTCGGFHGLKDAYDAAAEMYAVEARRFRKRGRK